MRLGYFLCWACVAIFILEDTILPPILQSLDSVHNTFMSVLWAHHAHANAVVHVAARCFRDIPPPREAMVVKDQEEEDQKMKERKEEETEDEEKEEHLRRERASYGIRPRNRWQSAACVQ